MGEDIEQICISYDAQLRSFTPDTNISVINEHWVNVNEYYKQNIGDKNFAKLVEMSHQELHKLEEEMQGQRKENYRKFLVKVDAEFENVRNCSLRSIATKIMNEGQNTEAVKRDFEEDEEIVYGIIREAIKAMRPIGYTGPIPIDCLGNISGTDEGLVGVRLTDPDTYKEEKENFQLKQIERLLEEGRKGEKINTEEIKEKIDGLQKTASKIDDIERFELARIDLEVYEFKDSARKANELFEKRTIDGRPVKDANEYLALIKRFIRGSDRIKESIEKCRDARGEYKDIGREFQDYRERLEKEKEDAEIENLKGLFYKAKKKEADRLIKEYQEKKEKRENVDDVEHVRALEKILNWFDSKDTKRYIDEAAAKPGNEQIKKDFEGYFDYLEMYISKIKEDSPRATMVGMKLLPVGNYDITELVEGIADSEVKEKVEEYRGIRESWEPSSVREAHYTSQLFHLESLKLFFKKKKKEARKEEARKVFDECIDRISAWLTVIEIDKIREIEIEKNIDDAEKSIKDMITGNASKYNKKESDDDKGNGLLNYAKNALEKIERIKTEAPTRNKIEGFRQALGGSEQDINQAINGIENLIEVLKEQKESLALIRKAKEVKEELHDRYLEIVAPNGKGEPDGKAAEPDAQGGHQFDIFRSGEGEASPLGKMLLGGEGEKEPSGQVSNPVSVYDFVDGRFPENLKSTLLSLDQAQDALQGTVDLEIPKEDFQGLIESGELPVTESGGERRVKASDLEWYVKKARLDRDMVALASNENREPIDIIRGVIHILEKHPEALELDDDDKRMVLKYKSMFSEDD